MFNMDDKGMDSMGIDFLSILRNMRNVTFPLSVYPCSNIRNKISMMGKQTNTFSEHQLLITISVCILTILLSYVSNKYTQCICCQY